MKKVSLFFLVMLVAIIIALLILTAQQGFWTTAAPILSIVLGWLLKQLVMLQLSLGNTNGKLRKLHENALCTITKQN